MADQLPMTPQQLQALIINAVNAAVANLNVPAGPAGPPGPSGPQGPQGHDGSSSNDSGPGRWNPGDVGFFDPFYEGKSAGSAAPIEHTGKETYFRDIHLFVERAKEMATIKGGETVRNNLWTCLRGAALEWWTAEVSDAEKRLTKYGNESSIDEWVTLLVARFKQPSHLAIDSVLRERYTMTDASNRREPREYAQKILRAAKDAGMTLIKNQLDIIFNGIDLELRRDIKHPEEASTVNAYLTALDECKHTWWAYASRHKGTTATRQQARPSYEGKQQNQSGQYTNPSYRTGYQPNFRSAGYQPTGTGRFPYPRNQAYQSNQYQQRNDQRSSGNQYQQRVLPPTQRLQITTAPNASGSAPQQPSPANRPFLPNKPYQDRPSQNRPYQGYQPQASNAPTTRPWDNRQPRFSQRAYQATPEDAAAEAFNFEDEYEQSAGQWQYHTTDDQEDESQDSYAAEGYHNTDDEGSQDAADVNFVQPSKKTDHCCHSCQATFSSRNKLFQHLKDQCWPKPSTTPKPTVIGKPNATASDLAESVKVPATPLEANLTEPINVKSNVVPDKTKPPGFGFRGWKYATIKVHWSGTKYSGTGEHAEEQTEICLDTGCSVTLIDRAYLNKALPSAEIRKMSTPMPVRGVGNKIIHTNEYVQIEMFVDGTIGGKPATGSFIVEAHIVEDLKANMLIGIDTLEPQGISIDFTTASAKIRACEELTVPVNVHAKAQAHTKRTVKSKSAMTVPARSTIQVPVAYKGMLADRDFLFEPECAQDFGTEGGVFAHIIDSSMTFVNVHNATDAPVRLPRKARLGSIVEFDQEGAYMVAAEHAPLSAGNTSTWKKKSWKSNLAKGLAFAAAAYAAMAQPSDPALRKPSAAPASATSTTVGIDPALEHVMPNGVTIYGTPDVAAAIAAVANDYPEIWTDQGTTVDIPEEEWMPIPLKSDAAPQPSRVYPVSQRDKDVINTTFDKLHQQGKMTWSSQPTPFSYPCFVVWREVNGIKKGRVVIDIRGLNKMTQNDSYPLPLQSDITSMVAGYPYISVCDAVGWFHQFSVQREDRHKLTVVSHRGQEQSNVALMGYKGSPPYVQRQTDRLLRPYNQFAKAYVDDMVVYSKTLQEHLTHLRKIFEMYRQRRISLSPGKSFLGYPSVILLGQRVDSLGLTTSEEKLAAISSLNFPGSLRDLEIFLGLTGWLRSSIPKYAQRAEPLQQRKKALTQQLPKGAKGQHRKTKSMRSHYDPSQAEINSFNDLKQAFAKPTFLVHFDPARPLFIDLDASKAWGFAAMIYHVKGDLAEGFPRTAVQPIMFLSKMLNQAEQNYWPTELEVAGIVWVVRKSRHMIESSRKPPTVIFTDHSAAVPISKQTSLSSSSTDKLNLRLIRASQYLSQFELTVKHKSGKSNVVPDALSRLKAHPGKQLDDVGVLDSLHAHHAMDDYTMDPSAVAYHITLAEMSDAFKQRLVQAYQDDELWKKILDMLRQDTPSDDEGRKLGLRFKQRDGLIYYTNFDDGRERLCIPNSLEKQIFELAHDRQHHGGFHRTYDRITGSLYLRHLSKRLRSYIEHCPDCQLNQTKRHKPYGNMMPIDRPGSSIPFHTISMDFIPTLPLTAEGFDNLLTITCKFSKRVLLIPGRTTWSASEWADVVLAALTYHDWGMPCGIISDRDAKFMSSFWRALFQKLGTDLLTSTAYHPQTDGQSERTNQTVEIAIRYYVTSHSNIDAVDWTLVLPYLQGYLNNSKNQATGVSPNEILYGFNVRDTLSMLSDLPAEDFTKLRQLKRDQAEESIAFANAFTKARYDNKHQPVALAVGDRAYLRLGDGYNIPGLTNPKLHHQRIGPFKVLERVGPLAYRLQLTPVMRIHPVVSIAQLEPAAKGFDPYGRVKHSNPPPVVEKDSLDPNEAEEYTIEALIGKRTSRNRTQYLVKWKGYGHEHNVWYDLGDLQDVPNLIQEYEARHPRGLSAKALPVKTPAKRGRPRKAPTPAPPKASTTSPITPKVITPSVPKAQPKQLPSSPVLRRSTRLLLHAIAKAVNHCTFID